MLSLPKQAEIVQLVAYGSGNGNCDCNFIKIAEYYQNDKGKLV